MPFSDGIADFRSDTVTRPTAEMRQAMAAAEVGDDGYGDDPTVNRLQEEAAAATGKDAALYVPSGTMANQLALGLQTAPGEELVCPTAAHIMDKEAGAPAGLWGLGARRIASETGDMPADLVSQLVENNERRPTQMSLLVWENTHNASGGTVTSLDIMTKSGEVARSAGWSIHLDGARIFNAAVASGSSVTEYAAQADTVQFCFSKGLGAPIGSILCGEGTLITEARFLRKRLGGGMRQAGVMAAAALIGLRDWPRLDEDHAAAATLGAALRERFPEAVDALQVQTNMVLLDSRQTAFTAKELIVAAGQAGIRLAEGRPGVLRLVTHRDIDQADVDRLLRTVDGLNEIS